MVWSGGKAEKGEYHQEYVIYMQGKGRKGSPKIMERQHPGRHERIQHDRGPPEDMAEHRNVWNAMTKAGTRRRTAGLPYRWEVRSIQFALRRVLSS